MENVYNEAVERNLHDLGGSAVNAKWTFFTNHAHVLFSISEDPDITLRKVALNVGITERATQRIVAELEDDGYLRHERKGRRNHYELIDDAPLRHSIEAHVAIGDILRVLRKDMADR
jgi:DNA-binding MarR family transcriptional regulator